MSIIYQGYFFVDHFRFSRFKVYQRYLVNPRPFHFKFLVPKTVKTFAFNVGGSITFWFKEGYCCFLPGCVILWNYCAWKINFYWTKDQIPYQGSHFHHWNIFVKCFKVNIYRAAYQKLYHRSSSSKLKSHSGFVKTIHYIVFTFNFKGLNLMRSMHHLLGQKSEFVCNQLISFSQHRIKRFFFTIICFL